MKLIKSIYKKITPLDIFFGIVLVVILATVYIFFHRKVEFVNIRVKITDEDVLYASSNPKSWYANRFNMGDSEFDELGRLTSQITKVETFNMTADSKAVYLDIKIKAVYDPRSKSYSAKGTNLVFGNTIRFNYTDISFNSLITNAPKDEYQKNLILEKKTVKLLQRGGWEPIILEKIKKADKIYDSNGNPLIEIIDVQLTPAQQITQNSQGDLLVRYNPYYKDATIIASVTIKKYKNEEFVFDTIPLKLGQVLPLNFSYESIFPTIIDIK